MTAPTPRRNLADAALTEAVLASFAGAPGPRAREITQSLVRHLHAFVEEVAPTEAEWFAGIEFLTRAGHITTDTRQEFVLLSDVLGVSMLVIGQNHRAVDGATESTVFGPFFVDGAPELENGADLAAGAPGRPCLVMGRILSTAGSPVAGAVIDVWQADEAGLYDVQYDDLDAPRGRGRLRSEADGRFWFWSIVPVAYPIPADGPAGELMRAGGRDPMRPAHVHFRVEAGGFETLITHVFAAGDPHLDTDAVFGVKSSLVAPFLPHDPGTAPDGREMDVPYHMLEYDLVLAPRTAASGG
ncbi:MAG TPA: intradiol ring-cleavage dioxygenase [Gaiellales bacterium]